MARPTQMTMCSFCGKSHAEVKKLIQGPGVYICDTCVTLCKSALDKELRAEVARLEQGFALRPEASPVAAPAAHLG